jgi:proteasome lid subunit RPN8/RPN11
VKKLLLQKVILTREVLESLLTYSRINHPREGILLLRGKRRKDLVEVDSVMIPPSAIHGEGFASFNWSMLPIDLSFVGVAHSHPSGHAVPSHEDLLHVTGSIMIIVGFPYLDEGCLGVYDWHGNRLSFEVK